MKRFIKKLLVKIIFLEKDIIALQNQWSETTRTLPHGDPTLIQEIRFLQSKLNALQNIINTIEIYRVMNKASKATINNLKTKKDGN